MQRLRVEQHVELAHQVERRLGDAAGIGMHHHRLRMRRQRIKPRPGSHVPCIAGERRVHPPQGLGQALLRRARLRQPAPRHVLHQPVHQERLAYRVARHQRVSCKIAESGVCIFRLRPWRGDVQQEVGHRVRRQEGEAFQQVPPWLS